jgi:hypothetical protein
MLQKTLIENALDEVIGVWQVEAKDVRDRGPKGFDWLPGSHLVSVRAVPVDDSDQSYLFLGGIGGLDVQPRQDGVRLSVTTKVLSDFAIGNFELLNTVAPSLSSTYSIVYPPASLSEQFAKAGSIGLIQAPCDLEFFQASMLTCLLSTGCRAFSHK